MGLFSRKKVITVFSTTVNLAGDEQQNYLLKTVNAAVMNNSDIASTISSAYLNGMGTKIKQAYNYGRDYYELGLPDGHIYYGTPNNEALLNILEANVPTGSSVQLTMSNFGVANLDYWIEQYLTEQYGWDEDHGGFSNPPPGVSPTGRPGWGIRNNGEAVIDFFNGVGGISVYREYKTFNVDWNASYYQVIYRVITPEVPTVTTEVRPYDEDDEAGTTSSSETINDFGLYTYRITTVTTSINEDETETTIVTTVTDNTLSRKQYFMYKAGEGTYPTLDSIEEDSTKDSEYYPVVPLRVDGTDYTDPDNVSEEQYKTSKTLLRKLGLKLTMLGDKLNENPDIGDIDHAFFVLGISLNSVYPSSIDYLHEFFKYLASSSPSTKEQYVIWDDMYGTREEGTVVVNLTAPKPPVNSLNLNQGPYDVTISYQYAHSSVVIGSIGPVGTVTRESGPSESILIKNTFDVSTELSTNITVIYFRKQITPTTYEQIEVMGLQHSNNVYKGHSVDITGEASLADVENEGFLIPLCQVVVDAQNLVNRTQMTYDCLHIVVNSYEETKAKWYQTGIFKVVTIVIAVVITVYSAGSLASGAIAAASAATAAGTSVAIAVGVFLLTQVAIGLAITIGVSFAAKYISPQILMIAAVAMLAYGAVSSYQNYGSAASKGLPYGNDVMAAGSSVMKGTTSRLQYDLQSVMKEMELNQESYQAQLKDIADAYDILGSTNQNIDIDAYIDAAFFNLFEAPGDFLSRTLNSNPGIDTLSSISNYVYSTLSLPTDLNS